ncbi:MAG: hypothetical protein LBD32_02395 [Cytophagales bacterium]|jgi:hypothetical protein|nr:hypothetical protein [Cytophagales bacterium]
MGNNRRRNREGVRAEVREVIAGIERGGGIRIINQDRVRDGVWWLVQRLAVEVDGKSCGDGEEGDDLCRGN